MNLATATSSSGGAPSFGIIFLIAIIIIFVLSIYLIIRLCKNHLHKVKNGKCKKLNLCFKILCLLGCIVDFVIIGFISNWDFTPKDALLIILILFIPGILTQCLYFVPYLIANSKGHLQENAIFILNLFAGWTILAWIIALVWACTESNNINTSQKENLTSNACELQKYKELLDANAITMDEFEAIKQKILNNDIK